MTRRLYPWILVGFALTSAGLYTLCASHPDGGIPQPSHAEPLPARAPEEASSFTAPPPTPPREAEQLPSSRNWCEPLTPPLCQVLGETCSPLADGTPRKCSKQWTRPHATELVCVASPPKRAERKWRRARLRTIVDSVCTRGKRCQPGQLTSYLAVIATRETRMGPWERHVLVEDIHAARVAWRKYEATYAGSPAHDEPWRWMSGGVGYYGQNPALLVAKWDATAEPEVLCGEVESTLVHLRTARKRYARLAAGVECEGREFHGSSADGHPSWYDVSLVNSGSRVCPGVEGKRLGKRMSFERRAARLGLDPYGNVTRKMLGSPVEVSVQDQFAADMRLQLANEHPRE